MTHRELVMAAARAQDHSEWMVWCEPVLGVQTKGLPEARPDLLLIRKSWARYEVRIIEVKVNQSDLEQDVRALKFEKYFPWAHRVSFLCGPGVKHDSLLPHPVGIQRWVASGPQTRRAPPLLKRETDMTKSFEMLHALNMNKGRFREDSRDERVRDARMELEQIDLKKAARELYQIKTDHIRDLARQAKEQIRSREDLEAGIRREIREESRAQLKDLLKINGYGSYESMGAAIRSLVRDSVHDAETKIMDGVAALVKKVEQDYE